MAMLLAILTFMCFAALDTGAKYLVTAGYAAIFVVWCRFISHTVISFIAFQGWRRADMYRVNNMPLQVLRGLLLPATTLFNFMALRELQLAQTISIFLSVPMLVTAMAGPLLGEWAGPRRWAAIMVGFIGVLIVVRPGTDVFSLAIIWSILAATTYSLYSIVTRKLAMQESQPSLVFYSSIFATVLLAPPALIYGQVPGSTFDWLLLASLGAFGLGGHALLVKASRLASASKLAPFVYSQLLWMTGLGFIVFGDVPDGWTMVGASIICISGIYIMNRERQIARNERKLAALG
ncbi:Permease of the drug/metabolite transporter (DMT) superfamily [Hoeflea phototrophica DFL-43]|uniref:Permease of the drug/metabolite transporter (DMT) superfamily n=1 Tax=Hoeflea phototrophica (strain DSM 17068 / NCIMB 14078 / DFL-43) TaxID=411684 RepID=A9DFZ1_HOEPD|nr:Permease of the drug/metabolite transporter (DMT) superfamily [Hoeflea phototrophica DFL-43]